jgi:hypothetical protein
MTTAGLRLPCFAAIVTVATIGVSCALALALTPRSTGQPVPLAGRLPGSPQATPRDGAPVGGPTGENTDLVIASPSPGTRTASVSTQISLLGRAALSATASDVRVTGSISGAHRGRVERYSTGDGESFLPAEPFVAGERVKVHTDLHISGASNGTWWFLVGRRLTVVGHEPLPALSTSVAGVARFASAPGIEPPKLQVLTGSGSAGGDVLITPKGAVGQAGPMIADSSGHLVWFDPLSGAEAFDLDVQRLGSQHVLTWFQGVVVGAHGSGEDVIDNLHYQTIAVVRGGNGFAPDLHEFQLLRDGVAYLTSYQALHEDLAPVGGARNGLVWDSIAQEIDVRTGLVEYEWHSLDHVGPALSVIGAPERASHVYDYFHINSIQPLTNGDLLVSARNTSAVYEISPAESGRVVWELGGRRSNFVMGAAATFWLQHDAEMPSPGTMTIFDDEASPPREPRAQSRAIVLRLDLTHMTATLEHAYVHSPALLGGALGNVQTKANGELVVDWGTTRYSSEFEPSGALVFDASLPAGDDTYRTYRRSWTGRPLTPPSLVVLRAGNRRRLNMSWNGATGVVAWRVLAAPPSAPLHPAATVPSAGFQTGAAVPDGAVRVQVQALGTGGTILGSSAVESTS